MSNFTENEKSSGWEFFQSDDLSWVDGKLMYLFYVGLALFLIPVAYYRVAFGFDGEEMYVQYIKNCLSLSFIASYAILRFGMFLIRLFVGRVYPGPKI